MNDETQVETIRAEVAPVVARAQGLQVRNPVEYGAAADFLKAVKAAQKQVVDHFGGMKAAAHAAWKNIVAKESDAMKPLADAESAVKGRMIAFQSEQERIRQAEQRRLQAEADARAEAERKALEKKAAAMKTDAKREEYLERAAEVQAPAVVVAPVVPKVAGQAIVKRWTAVVTDKKALAGALLTWPDWEAYIEINSGELNRLAARTKGAISLPGLEFRQVSGLSSRGA